MVLGKVYRLAALGEPVARVRPLDPCPRPSRGVPSNAPPRPRERKREPPGRFEAKRLKGGVMSGHTRPDPPAAPCAAPLPPLLLFPLPFLLLCFSLFSLFPLFSTSLLLSYGRPFSFLCTAGAPAPLYHHNLTPLPRRRTDPRTHPAYAAATLGISRGDTRRGVAVCGDDVAPPT